MPKDGYYRRATETTFNCSLKCPTNCKSCSNLNHCHECKEPFYNEDAFYNCSRRCPQNCEACLSSTLCMKCKQPYYNDKGVTNCSLACGEQHNETQNREEEVTSMFDKILRTPEISVVVTFISAVVLTLVVERTVRLIRRRLDRPSVDKEKDSQTTNQTVKLHLLKQRKGRQIAGMNTFTAIILIWLYSWACAPSASGSCGNCSHELCLSSGYCLYGCKLGYRGGACRNTCAQSKCQLDTDCYREGVYINGQWRYKCELCQDGYYRGGTEETFNCSLKCPTNCKSCSNLNQCNECKETYYIEGAFLNCSRRCPQNCEACLSPTWCTKCKPPYYNDVDMSVTNCSLSCFEKCKDCESGKCFSCVDGYFDVPSKCSLMCSSNCLSCSSEEKCDQCKAGYFNKNNTSDPNNPPKENCRWNCRQNCLECTDNDSCQICINGTYGTVCENQCSIGCSNNICDKETGACDCGESFSGDKCCVRSPYCKTCSSATECSVCKTGHFGDTCQNNCSGTCLGGCDIISGRCNDCEINTYGRFCEKNCSQGCLDNGTVLCNAFNGTCLHGCITGYYGKQCDKECEAICKGGCNASSGVCDDCFTNTFGLFCNSNCSLGCINSSESETTCDRLTGTCLFGCLNGFFTDHCNKRCSQTCQYGCDHKTGHCLSCINDKYGLYCNNSCPDNCFSQNNATKCNETTGRCLYGCTVGNYGEHCLKNCNDNCVKKTCNVSSGECTLGCKGSYTDFLCIEDGANSLSDNFSKTVAISIVVTFIVAVVITLLILRTVRLVRGRLQKQVTEDERRTRNQTVGIYEGLEAEQKDQTTDYDTIQNEDSAYVNTNV